jgi:hypothetical protein
MSVKEDLNISVFGGAKGWKRIGAQKSDEFRIIEKGNNQQDTKKRGGVSEPTEVWPSARVDVFDVLKKVPMFTGSEDVEEWLWKVGFVF